MTIKKIKEIKHLLPENCWVVKRNIANNNEMDEEYVLHIEGDFETENLDLDAPLISFGNRFDDYLTYLQQEGLLLILIEGNFTANNVYNYETDGSTGLMVLGNATVNNLVVGGQEIYIAQNLTVKECFWGHYNHGDLVVNGKLQSKIFIATEEYHYNFEKEIFADYFLKDDNEDDNYEPTLPKAIFVPELIEEVAEEDLEDVFSFAEWINRSAVIEYLVENKAILNAEIIVVSEEEKQQQLFNAIPKQFGDSVFNDYEELKLQISNFEKLFEIAKMHPQDFMQAFEWNGYWITLHYENAENEVNYILGNHNRGLQYFIYINLSEEVVKDGKGLLNVLWRGNAEQEFANIDGDSPKKAFIALQQFWTEILTRAERGAYFYKQFLATVKCEDLMAYLASPVIKEKYNDYWDSDKNGFWYGDYYVGARINGARDLPGSVDIGKEINGDGFDIRKYFLRLNEIENPTFPVLHYNSSQAGKAHDRYQHHNNLQQVFLYDWEYYQEALKWYPKIAPAIAQQNKWHHEEKEETLKKEAEIAEKKNNPKPLPFTEMEFEGITFKVINLAEADALIGGLTDFKGEKIYDVFEDTWRFPNYEDNCFFLLAEDDVTLEKFDLDYSTEANSDIFILGFIFLKNLKTEKYILAYDTDNSPALIVLGKVETVNINLFGNIHYIGKGLQCDTLWGFYNHGELFVKGDTTAWLIYADDMDFHFEKFGGVEAVISREGQSILVNSILKDTDGSIINVENYFPSTNRLSDIVVDGFVQVNEYGVEGLSEEEPNNALTVVQDGMSLIDHDKKNRFEYADFPQRLKEMFTKLNSLDEVKANNIVTKTDGDTYSFSLFTHQEVAYQQLMVEVGGSYGIRMRTLFTNKNEESLLLLEYLDEKGEPKYQWQGNAETTMLELKCVKKAMIDAYEMLTEGLPE